MLISDSIRNVIISHDGFLEILKEKNKEYNGLKNEGKLKILKKAFDFLSKIIIDNENLLCRM